MFDDNKVEYCNNCNAATVMLSVINLIKVYKKCIDNDNDAKELFATAFSTLVRILQVKTKQIIIDHKVDVTAPFVLLIIMDSTATWKTCSNDFLDPRLEHESLGRFANASSFQTEVGYSARYTA